MLLTQDAALEAVQQVKAAFPAFQDWQCNNEEDRDHEGFSAWGHHDVMDGARYFLTFDTYKNHWRGHLTVGQHAFYWSDADMGDVHLLQTNPCDTLEDAVLALRKRLSDLFAIFQVAQPA